MTTHTSILAWRTAMDKGGTVATNQCCKELDIAVSFQHSTQLVTMFSLLHLTSIFFLQVKLFFKVKIK